MIPVTDNLLTPVRHSEVSALRVKVVYALAVDPDAAANEPLV
jgi:hypothetical protein